MTVASLLLVLAGWGALLAALALICDRMGGGADEES